ncbi:hypothetical protein [Deinococcus hopiensis]|uniref:hypothetical protein n=1 Tax=Deinococcus hopiensis TaxID=309885 RepID=UPI000A00BAF4|nr:hypothetical protein [Deinococcus hopiensis]
MAKPSPYLAAVWHTDRLAADKEVVFGALHRIEGTQHIGGFHATLRLKLPHLVRTSLSFTRNQDNLETVL